MSSHEFSPFNRRGLLKRGIAAGATLGLADLGFLSNLRPVSAAEAQVDSKRVRLDSGIEPVVRLIEETPRDSLLEEVGGRLRKGSLSYQELLTGLLLAGVRNVEPRPSVGFKFHAVLVVNSAHLASLASPAAHRWLPIFWALDYFKVAAADDERERQWTMPPVDESAVPAGDKAREMFVKAMSNWDETAADVAVAGFARSGSANELFDLFCRFGARDLRSIGHKAIFVANGFRTLQTIGWEHAEPVLRSLAYALLMHEGENPESRDDATDRPYRKNLELVKTIRPDWRSGKIDESATAELLRTLHGGSNEEASALCVELLNRGVAPQSLWDALFVAAGELVVRQSGIVSLHAVTTTNALHYAYQTTGDDETRRLLLLQNAAFLPMFRESMGGRGQVEDVSIATLDEGDKSPENAEEVFRVLSEDPMLAARQAKRWLDGQEDPRAAADLMHVARTMIFLKGSNSHDYKFSSAVLEDFGAISPKWRNAYLASNLFLLRGAGAPTNSLVKRTEAALKG